MVDAYRAAYLQLAEGVGAAAPWPATRPAWISRPDAPRPVREATPAPVADLTPALPGPAAPLAPTQRRRTAPSADRTGAYRQPLAPGSGRGEGLLDDPPESLQS